MVCKLKMGKWRLNHCRYKAKPLQQILIKVALVGTQVLMHGDDGAYLLIPENNFYYVGKKNLLLKLSNGISAYSSSAGCVGKR